MSEFPPSFAPTYGSASRTIQIVHWLHQSPLGVSLDELRDRLNVSDRTIARYVQVLKEALIGDDGQPLVEVIRTEGASRLRFRRRELPLDGSALELLSLFLALDLMAFLEGTLFRDGARDVMQRFHELMRRTGNHKAALLMKDFDRKFHHWSEAPKDYRQMNRQLELIIDGLIRQHHLEIQYQAPQRDAKSHLIEPLTLLMYKRGLYLIGRKVGQQARDLTFAVERIRAVKVCEEGFSYPSNYDPAQRFQHHFGLVGGEAEDLVLWFNAQVAENVVSRTWHPSQEMERLRDGSALLSMHVAVNEELISWMLSYGSYLSVISPKKLRDTVEDRHRQALQSKGPDINSLRLQPS